MNPIAPIQPIVGGSERAGAVTRPAGGTDFADVLGGAIEQAREKSAVSEDMTTRFADGDPSVGIHEVIIASEKASVSMRYAVTLKNKLVDAYRELMSTPV
jgi:flagellar hook-basal body complex protein FliE